MGDQVGAGVLGQGIWVNPGGVFACESKTQGAAPARLLFSDLGDGIRDKEFLLPVRFWVNLCEL